MRSLGTAAASVLLAVLTACGGGGESRVGGAAPTTEASGVEASSNPTPSEPGGTDGGTPGESPSEPTSGGPSVTPADGPVLRTSEGVSIRVPRGFDADAGGTVVSAARQSDLASVIMSTRPIIGEPDFDQLKRIARQGRSAAPNFRVLPDIEWAGEPAFHFVSDFTEFMRRDEYGMERPEEGLIVSLEISTLDQMPRAERDELIGSVLASLDVG